MAPIEAINYDHIVKYWHIHTKKSWAQSILFQIFSFLTDNIPPCEILDFHQFWATNVERAKFQKSVHFFGITCHDIYSELLQHTTLLFTQNWATISSIDTISGLSHTADEALTRTKCLSADWWFFPVFVLGVKKRGYYIGLYLVPSLTCCLNKR